MHSQSQYPDTSSPTDSRRTQGSSLYFHTRNSVIERHHRPRCSLFRSTNPDFASLSRRVPTSFLYRAAFASFFWFRSSFHAFVDLSLSRLGIGRRVVYGIPTASLLLLRSCGSGFSLIIFTFRDGSLQMESDLRRQDSFIEIRPLCSSRHETAATLSTRVLFRILLKEGVLLRYRSGVFYPASEFLYHPSSSLLSLLFYLPTSSFASTRGKGLGGEL